MRCPDEIAETLLSILQIGILRIRSLAWQGEADLCGVESDHIHNLPDLIADYTPAKLSHYLDIERPEYLRLIQDDLSSEWEPLWHQLERHVEVIGSDKYIGK
jgi:hypothetical protein